MNLRHLAIAVALIAPLPASARPCAPPPPQDLARQLGLSAEQTPRFVAVLEAQGAKRRALHQQVDGEHEALREEMRALHEQTVQLLTPILSAEQLAQFESLRPPRPPMPPRDGGGNAPPRGPDARGPAPDRAPPDGGPSSADCEGPPPRE